VAKYKRKISSTQRDKNLIYAAKQLKKAGILSKQTKLHGGRYISKEVVRKVKEFQHAADLGYKAVKVPKKLAEAAKARGWQTVGGNKVIGPTTATFRNRLKRGELTGVRPVKGGMMEEVELPHTVYDMRTLVEQLKEGIDSLKLPEEYFAFKYQGNESYRVFPNTKELLDYMLHYKADSNIYQAMAKPENNQEEFANFSIVRLHGNDQYLMRGPTQRKRERLAAGIKPQRRTRKSKAEYLATLPRDRADYIRAQMAKKDRKKREKRMANPAEYEAYKEAARKRAQASRERRKK
jgi:hypothetical protein